MNIKTTITLLICIISSLSAKTASKEGTVLSSSLQIKIIQFQKSSNSLNLIIGTKPFEFNYQTKSKQANGDVFIESKNKDSYLQATIGKNSLFGQLHIADKHYQITTTKDGIHALDISSNNLQINDCGLEHPKSQLNLNKSKFNTKGNKQGSEDVIDVFFLYSHSMRDRYPDDLIETRLNQYINVANQSFANSNIDLAVRKVGQELKNYGLSEHNTVLLGDMRTSLTGSPIPGIGNLNLLREQFGVDMFVYIRPHDILTRGNCGVAYFPEYDAASNSFEAMLTTSVLSIKFSASL